ncbi:hypothetical protein P7K49_014914 [Saguinus oedipus]|uniref:A to I editase domain-containing protein n=1 Tax=Saguinus oedipus TaxID=9490 RepID=A0ABQ9V884_SAGOE|nr:hypothetical protein P7K49_014914 [Saguinus oedipus]
MGEAVQQGQQCFSCRPETLLPQTPPADQPGVVEAPPASLGLSTRTPSPRDTPSMYCEAKLGAHTYQAVKQQLFLAFQKAGLGTWVQKPPEQQQFLLTL